MIPAGQAVDIVIDDLIPGSLGETSSSTPEIPTLQTQVRANVEGARDRKPSFLDVGVSGGIGGKSEGYCIMIGVR